MLQNGCLASHLQQHFGYVSGRADAECGNAKSASLWGVCSCRVAEMDRQALCGFSQACFRCLVKAALLVLELMQRGFCRKPSTNDSGQVSFSIHSSLVRL